MKTMLAMKRSRTEALRSGAAIGAVLAAVCLLAACETLNARPPVDVAEPTSVRPQTIPRPVVNNGAIFQASNYRPLFEDHRARLVGDTLTVQIVGDVAKPDGKKFIAPAER